MSSNFGHFEPFFHQMIQVVGKRHGEEGTKSTKIYHYDVINYHLQADETNSWQIEPTGTVEE